MSLCHAAAAVKIEENSLEIASLPCRSWGCPQCRRRRWRELKALGEGGVPNTFITLTVNPAKYMSPSARAQELAHAWRRVRRRALKTFNLQRLPFIAVFEKTKRGEPHLHILCRVPWLPQSWLSAQMEAEIGAPIVDIRRVKNASQAIRYVAKYIGKDPHRFDGVKRYWRSQDYVLAAEKANPNDYCIIRWDWSKWSAEFLADDATDAGYQGAWLTPRKWLGFLCPPGERVDAASVARHRGTVPQC